MTPTKGSGVTIWGGATSRTMRAHWAAHELALDYTPRLIGSRTGETQSEEFVRLNPKEKIPVLVDGDLVLTESAAIVTYLGDSYSTDGLTLTPPVGTIDRAKYNEWLSYILMELDAHTLYVIRKHGDLASLYGEAPAAIEAAKEGFTKQVGWALPRVESADYLVGDGFTGADIVMTTCLDWAHAYGLDLAQSFHDYRRRIHERPAFATARELNFSISAGA